MGVFSFGVGQRIIAKSNGHVARSGPCCNVLLPPFIIMRDIASIVSFFSIAAGISMLTAAVVIDIKAPVKDAVAYSKCIKLHPARYCSITHLGAN